MHSLVYSMMCLGRSCVRCCCVQNERIAKAAVYTFAANVTASSRCTPACEHGLVSIMSLPVPAHILRPVPLCLCLCSLMCSLHETFQRSLACIHGALPTDKQPAAREGENVKEEKEDRRQSRECLNVCIRSKHVCLICKHVGCYSSTCILLSFIIVMHAGMLGFIHVRTPLHFHVGNMQYSVTLLSYASMQMFSQ